MEASPTCFCIEMLFLELVSGDFLGEGQGRGLFWDSIIPTCSFIFSPVANLFFGGVKRYHLMWFCEVEADLSAMIVKSLPKYVLSCIIFFKICLL